MLFSPFFCWCHCNSVILEIYSTFLAAVVISYTSTSRINTILEKTWTFHISIFDIFMIFMFKHLHLMFMFLKYIQVIANKFSFLRAGIIILILVWSLFMLNLFQFQSYFKDYFRMRFHKRVMLLNFISYFQKSSDAIVRYRNILVEWTA